MKNAIFPFAKPLAISGCALLLSLNLQAQSHVTMSVRHISSTPQTIEYDLYVENDGQVPLLLSACSFGVNYDAEIVNGGDITYQFMQHTRSQAAQNLSPISLRNDQSATLAQARMTGTPVCFDKSVALPSKAPLKIGRFRISNTHPWKANSYAHLQLQEKQQVALTCTQLLAYEDQDHKLMALTPANGKVTCVVESDVLLNPVQQNQPMTLAAETGIQNRSLVPGERITWELYPNPASTEIHIRLQSEQNETLHAYLRDVHGRLLHTWVAQLQKGNNPLQWNIQELKTGIYTLSLMRGNEILQSKSFIKQ